MLQITRGCMPMILGESLHGTDKPLALKYLICRPRTKLLSDYERSKAIPRKSTRTILHSQADESSTNSTRGVSSSDHAKPLPLSKQLRDPNLLGFSFLILEFQPSFGYLTRCL